MTWNFHPTPNEAPRRRAEKPLSTWAVLAFLAAIVPILGPLAPLTLGHVAKREIKRTGDAGSALATWALVLAYLALFAVLFVGVLALVGFATSNTTT